MRRTLALVTLIVFLLGTIQAPDALAYASATTIPSAGGCPQPDRWNPSPGLPINRRWSTSLSPIGVTVVTTAAQGTPAQLDEIEAAISASFGAWSGVAGTTVNSTANPAVLAPLTRTSVANSCSNDQESNIDGLNTICFNQSSTAFTSGVLSFTRVITANSAGASVGPTGPAAFAGQILDADILLRNDRQVTFATPGALASSPGSYDLESILSHELGHWFGLEHSAVWRAMMFPFSPPPGQFLGARPTSQVPDGPLSDDDRAGIRSLYPDPNDSINVGMISGRVLPANTFALANVPAPSIGTSVTGIFGAHVVALDSDSGAVAAATVGGWSCSAASGQMQFDGSYQIERLPLNRRYKLYVEPIEGLVTPADFSGALAGLCSLSSPTPCATPAVNTNFNVRTRPESP